MKEIFYFIRDKENRPIISVCLLIDMPKVIARGVAICSDRDTPCTKLNAHQSNGPGIAKRRAWKALKNKKDMYRINRKEALNVLDHIRSFVPDWEDINFPTIYQYKASYLPTLSLKEQRILRAMK